MCQSVQLTGVCMFIVVVITITLATRYRGFDTCNLVSGDAKAGGRSRTAGLADTVAEQTTSRGPQSWWFHSVIERIVDSPINDAS
jgi:hypothetical protein